MEHLIQARDIGQRVRDARLQAALTQEEAAKRAGISAVAWGNIENGHSIPRPATARKLAEALGIDAGYLLTGKMSAEELPWVDEIPRDTERRSLETRPTKELLTHINFLLASHRATLEAVKKIPEGPHRDKGERDAQDLFEDLTSAMLEMQGRLDANLEVRNSYPFGPKGTFSVFKGY
jgi:transcriptional regulator with XRE-family HTH domain